MAGPDRASTAAVVAQQLWASEGPISRLVIDGYAADGWAWGLASSTLAATDGIPLLMASADGVLEVTLTQAGCADVLLVGPSIAGHEGLLAARQC